MVNSLALYEGFLAEFDEKLDTLCLTEPAALIALEDLTATLESAMLQCAALRRDLSRVTALAFTPKRSSIEEKELK